MQTVPSVQSAQIVNMGRSPYAATEAAMRQYTLDRDAHTADQLWLVEHDPVFTQGVAGRPEHLLFAADALAAVPVVQTDRGGQVTYHGPGQVVVYTLVDLKRLSIFVKEYVFRVEAAVIDTLADLGVTGHRVRGAPGIYLKLADPFGHAVLHPTHAEVAVANKAAKLTPDMAGLGKIAALGIKVSRHCTYHGVALNVAMDLAPFSLINPCGYAGLQTVDLSSLGVQVSWDEAAQRLAEHLARRLS
jgi:lipoyl(octanoyl) transferase